MELLSILSETLSDVSVFHIVLEIFLALSVLWLISRKSSQEHKLNLTEAEKEQLISDWEPEPLVEEVLPSHPALKPKVVNGKAGLYVQIDDYNCINFATHNYLGFVELKTIEDRAIKSLYKYGVGSCGPRGFYGTVDVHLELEEYLAKFMHMEEAVVYSFNFSTIASAIPAYSKRGDIIFVDERVNFAIQKGLDASRSQVKYFKHNDPEHLESLLKEQEIVDKKNPKKAMKTRRCLVVEGIYMNTGEICPLPELIELRKKYKLRIFIDESISFGTLGKTGRGVTEYFDVPITEVDLIVGSMEHALAAVGGFCVGSSFIVEHQRLSGLGYCFSASQPPLLASAAIAALETIEQNPDLVKQLRDRSHWLHRALHSSDTIQTHFNISGDEDSPIKHLVAKNLTGSYQDQLSVLNRVGDSCIEKGVAVITSSYLEDKEVWTPVPSIRLTTNVLLTIDHINTLIKALENVCNDIFNDNN